MFFFQRNKGCGTRDKLNTAIQLQDIKFKFGFGPFHNRTFHTFIALCHFYFRSRFKHNLSSQSGVECHAEPFKRYPYLRWSGHGNLFSKCASQLLPNLPAVCVAGLPASGGIVERPHSRKQPACAHINDCRHDKGSIKGLSNTEITGLINIP
jgi:hypothetical protein